MIWLNADINIEEAIETLIKQTRGHQKNRSQGNFDYNELAS